MPNPNTKRGHIRRGRNTLEFRLLKESAIVVNDVFSDLRYLACSLETRSEIVAPIDATCKIAGEIDINGHARSVFGTKDRISLQQCTTIIGQFTAAR